MRTLDKEREEQLFALRKQGYSLRQIGRLLQRSHVSVLQALRVSPKRRQALRLISLNSQRKHQRKSKGTA